MAKNKTNLQKLEARLEKSFKDDPKFLIVSSIIVPLIVAGIGLVGLFVPADGGENDSNKEDDKIEESKDQSEILQEQKPEILENTFGFLSKNGVIAAIEMNSNEVNLKDENSDKDYEIQRLDGEYYLVGFTKKDFKLDELTLVPVSSGEYSKLVAIKFEDITSIEDKEIKIRKKEKIEGLVLKSKGIRTDVSVH